MNKKAASLSKASINAIVFAYERKERVMKQQVSLAIVGMSCEGCAKKISRELNALDGVKAEVNFALEKTQLELNDRKQLKQVAETVDKLGYQLPTQRLEADVTGMTCASCANKIEKALYELPEVVEVEVNAATEKLQAKVLAGTLTMGDIKPVVENLGYQITGFNSDSQSRKKALEEKEAATAKAYKKQKWQVIIAFLLSAPLMLGMVAMFSSLNVHLPPWLEFALATPVQFFIGWRFYLGAYNSLKNGSANMDVLVATGTSAAYFYSVYLWLSLGQGATGQLYFEASAVVITLISLGKWLETKAKHSTTDAIRKLMALRPDVATVLRDGQWQEVAIDEVHQGDTLRVLTGEKIPVDGIVSDGQSDVDESLVTGESLPVHKQKDDEVIAGSINGQGQLQIAASRVGEDTSLAKIITMVDQAQMGKAPVQQLVDKISAVFVPVVIAIAVLTFVAWYFLFGVFADALIASVSVLVIACPCALGLATPAAIVTGTGAAAKHGILIKDVDTLQKAHNIQAVVFDKTGTLTIGKPEVLDIISDNNDEHLLLAASLQQSSSHPLAKAIVAKAKEQNLSLNEAHDVNTASGFGIKGEVTGKAVLMGNDDFLAQENIELVDWPLNNNFAVASTVNLAVDGKVVALFALADTLKETSLDAVRQLKSEGIHSQMISGDSQKVVDFMAKQLGLDEAFANVKPDEKAQKIIELRKPPIETIAMVGDGINDAPALAEADVGIAMGSGTDVAMETANITLMRSDPLMVVDAIDISKATWKKIQQNLFWAFIFNSLGIPLAAFGLLSPMVAGAAMALSSVMVLGNSLLLNRWQSKAG